MLERVCRRELHHAVIDWEAEQRGFPRLPVYDVMAGPLLSAAAQQAFLDVELAEFFNVLLVFSAAPVA